MATALFHRFRQMTPAEIGWRVLRAVQARTEKGRLEGRPVPRPDLAGVANPWVFASPKIDPSAYIGAAERIEHGWVDVYAIGEVQLGTPPRWNRDPKSGIEAPLLFGKLLDIGDTDLVGDIKYTWHPNRHLHLVTLAQAWAFTRKRAYYEALKEQLESWFLACPHGLGPNWSSALEAAVRLINWSAAWQLLGGAHSKLLEQDADFRDKWLRSVYQHAQFIRGWFTLHSSAGHRLLGEAAGLFIAALAWPHWPEARGWAGTAKSVLEREALAQNAPDGVNREQSIANHLFVLDLLLLAMLAGKANGQWFSADYESRIEAMLDFVASLTDAGGNLPMFGDSDDGFVTRLCPRAEFSEHRSLLASGALLFKRGDFKLKARTLDDRTRWLFGPGADAQFAELDAEKTRLPLRQAFPQGGYFVIGCGFDTRDEIRVVADAGPVGYRAVAAHGHADALSFTLSVGGREILVDPGTYAYHTQEAWRRYFRSTAAHNTLRVDALDQSVAGGRFLWLRKARAGCSLWLSSPQKDSFEGWHDGYMRLDDPVKHRRLIELDKTTRRVLIEDTLTMEDEHDVELFFHCSEACRVDEVPGGFLITNEEASVRMTPPDAGAAFVVRGSLSPMLGWRSRAFDSRVPAPVIVWQGRMSGQCVLRTELCASSS